MHGTFERVLGTLLLTCAVMHAAQAGPIFFDFEDVPATALPRTGALETLTVQKSGLKAVITRPGGRFDVVSNTGSQTKPARFGTRSLDPFYQETSATPFVIDFSKPVKSVSIDMGDYGADSPDALSIQAYSGKNGTGALVAEGFGSLPASGNQFSYQTVTATGPAIHSISISIIGGTPSFPNSVFYDNLAVTPLSFADAIAGAVTLTPGSNYIQASFTPNLGMTLTEAAELGGYDHFNWYQVATEYPGYATPFVDPPWGGLGLQRADELPFYWDETDCFLCDPQYSLQSNIDPNNRILFFDDMPGNTFIPLLGDKMSFTTHLVGVRSNGTWDVLSTFMWSSDFNPLCDIGSGFTSTLFGSGFDCGGVSTENLAQSIARNIEPFPPGGTGGVFGVHEVTNLSDLPLEVRLLMIRDGATNIPLTDVPEPSTALILSVGLLMLILWSVATQVSRTGKAPTTPKENLPR